MPTSTTISKPQAWAMAARLRTLPIPTIQIITSMTLAAKFSLHMSWTIALGAWLVACLITVGMNLINDVIDFEKGGDPLNRPGQLKMIPAGILTKSSVLAVGILCFTIACTVPLLLPVGWPICLLTLFCVLCGYYYTGGPFPISYLGLSELFIFIFYGWVCLIVPFYVQTGFVNAEIMLAASQMGLLAILPNALNNFRDIDTDAAVGKKTLAVRFGKTFAKWEITLLTFLPFAMNVCWSLFHFTVALYLPFIVLPIAILFIRGIWTSKTVDHYFKHSVLILFLFGLALSLSF